MKLKVIVVLLIVFNISCKQTNKKHQSAIKGLASPVNLEFGGGKLLLSDYFLETSKIDSIEKSKEYDAVLIENKTKVQFKVGSEMPAVSNLRVWVNGHVNDIPLFKSNKAQVTISIPDENKKHKDVKVKGEFSNWQQKPLIYANKKWSYTTKVNKGNHQYVLVVDGKEQIDPSHKSTISNGMGGTNSVLKIETNEDNIPQIVTKINEGKLTITSNNGFDNVLVYLNNVLYKRITSTNEKTELTFKLPNGKSKGRSHIRIFVSNVFGRSNDILIPLQNGKIINNVSALKRTDFHNQIMYFLLVDRFKDGNLKNTKKVANDSILPKVNYYGGDLEGVVNKIDDNYFSDLGINTIWLSPITQNPEGAFGLWKKPLTKFSAYHGYWPISNTKIDYRFGNEKVFKELIKKAHDKNMNVILDYVANHVHKEHPVYQKHPEWATSLYLPDGTMNTEKWDEHRLTTWFDTFLPTLDFSKKEVIEKMTDSAMVWVTKYDLDGFRHDATKHIQLEFWRTLTKKIKERTNRPIYQIGETYGSPELINSYINTGMLDAQFDFNVYDATVQAFASKNGDFEHLVNTVKKSLQYYGHHHLMGNISGNQDRARFISYASGDVKFNEDAKKAGWTRKIGMSDTTAYKKLEMLQAFNLTIPGIPCIYYGDEYGSIGANDPDNRKMMKFKKLDKFETNLKAKITELIKLRRNSMSLLYGSTQFIETSKKQLIFKRKYLNETATIIFNLSDKELKYNKLIIKSNDYNITITK